MLQRIKKLLPLQNNISNVLPSYDEMTVEHERISLNQTQIVRMAHDGSRAVYRKSNPLAGDRETLEIELHLTRFAAEQGFGPAVYAAELCGERDKAELRMLLEYLPNDGTYEDLKTLSNTLQCVAESGLVHTELLHEHVRFARGRGCFLIDFDPRFVHVVGAYDAEESCSVDCRAAYMAQLLLLPLGEAKAATKNDVWQRALPLNIDAWHGVRQLAKLRKPIPLVAIRTPDDDLDEPGALVSPFSPMEAQLDSTLEEKICFFLRRVAPDVVRHERRLSDPLRLLFELALREEDDAPWPKVSNRVLKHAAIHGM